MIDVVSANEKADRMMAANESDPLIDSWYPGSPLLNNILAGGVLVFTDGVCALAPTKFKMNYDSFFPVIFNSLIAV